MNTAQANARAGMLADQIVGELAMHGVDLVSRRPGADPKQLLGGILYREVYEAEVKPYRWPLYLCLIGAAVAVGVMWM